MPDGIALGIILPGMARRGVGEVTMVVIMADTTVVITDITTILIIPVLPIAIIIMDVHMGAAEVQVRSVAAGLQVVEVQVRVPDALRLYERVQVVVHPQV